MGPLSLVDGSECPRGVCLRQISLQCYINFIHHLELEPCQANVPVNSKTAHAPPGQTPGHLTFLKNFGQIPRYVAGETVKCPTRLSFKEGQIPHPPGMLKPL